MRTFILVFVSSLFTVQAQSRATLATGQVSCLSADGSLQVEVSFSPDNPVASLHIVEHDKEIFPTTSRTVGVISDIMTESSSLGDILTGLITPVYPQARPHHAFKIVLPRLYEQAPLGAVENVFSTAVFFEDVEPETVKTIGPVYKKIVLVVCRGMYLVD